MFLRDGKYDERLHHDSHVSVGVPGTVAGLHLAWQDHGKLPWRRLVEPAVALARDGFEVTDGLARSLAGVLRRCSRTPRRSRSSRREARPTWPATCCVSRTWPARSSASRRAARTGSTRARREVD